MGSVYLGAATVLSPNAEAIMGGPRMGNLKDPEKVAQKMAEWKAALDESSCSYPLARDLADWVLLGSEGKLLAEGNGPLALIESLIRNAEAIDRLFGVNARAVIKGAALQAAANGIVPPGWLWHFPFVPTNGELVVQDPINMLRSGFSEQLSAELVCQTLGVPNPYKIIDPLEQAKAVRAICIRVREVE